MTKGVEDGMLCVFNECVHPGNCHQRCFHDGPVATPAMKDESATTSRKCTCGHMHGHEGCVAAVDVSCGCVLHDDDAEEPTLKDEVYDPTTEEDEGADCEGCNRDDCKGCAYNEAHPPPDFVTKAGTRIFISPSSPDMRDEVYAMPDMQNEIDAMIDEVVPHWNVSVEARRQLEPLLVELRSRRERMREAVEKLEPWERTDCGCAVRSALSLLKEDAVKWRKRDA